jgi:peptidoglycan/LPS O-acetylase OafA/YrhL
MQSSSPQPSSAAGGRIIGLDGLRAVSIALVLGAHLKWGHGFPRTSRAFERLFLNGALGVSVFFVISGYLITSLLLREHDRTGGITLRHFYARRTLRIFPAYFAYVALVLALSALGAFAVRGGEAAAMLTYTRNLYHGGHWQTGHLWSLAIEEQFYLLWPFALMMARPRRATYVAAAIVAAAPLARLLTWVLWPSHRVMVDEYTWCRIDSIMFGCLLALVHREAWFARRIERFYARGGAALALVAVLASLFARAFTPYEVVLSYTVEGAGIAVLIHWCVTRPASRVTRLLELRPMRFVGDLTYSLYLWQQLFLNRASSSPLCRFPLNLLLAFGAALASRHLIEQPFLKLKESFRAGRVAPRALAIPPRTSLA